jgi:hypothetical protein
MGISLAVKTLPTTSVFFLGQRIAFKAFCVAY